MKILSEIWIWDWFIGGNISDYSIIGVPSENETVNKEGIAFRNLSNRALAAQRQHEAFKNGRGKYSSKHS